MREHEIRDAVDLVLYIADCQLATVDSLALTKSRSKSSYERHKSIAGVLVREIVRLGVDVKKLDEGNRVLDVIKAGSVDKYVEEFEVYK